MTIIRFEWAGRRLSADFPARFDRHSARVRRPAGSLFDAPPATARPFRAAISQATREAAEAATAKFSRSLACNGTHTECVGHVTEDRVAVSERVPGGLVLALLVTLEPIAATGDAGGQRPCLRPATGW